MDAPEGMEIRITDSLALHERDLHFDFVHASGPGGQNVNKVATAAQLRFDTSRLPDPLRARALKLAGARATRDGLIVIEAKRFRSRERNREDAIDRLAGLLRRAAQTPKPRKRTTVSRAARKRRLQDKRKQARRKQLRKTPAED